MVIFEEKTPSPVRPKTKKQKKTQQQQQKQKQRNKLLPNPNFHAPLKIKWFAPNTISYILQPARRHQTHLLIYNLENKVIHSSLDLQVDFVHIEPNCTDHESLHN